MMRFFSLLLAAVLALSPAAVLAKEDCSWHTNPGGGASFGTAGGAGSFTMEDSECLDISAASVVWLESYGCRCVVDMRIIATPRPCSVTDCDEYTSSVSVAGASSTGMMGTTSSGGGLVYHVETESVECGSPFVFQMSSSCECAIMVPTTTRERVPVGGGATAMLTTVQMERVVVCSSEAANSSWVAWCLEDCNPADPPDPIPIEGQ